MFYLSEMKSPGAVKASYKSLDGVSINGFVVTSVPPSVSIDPTDFRRYAGDDLNDISHPGVLTRDAVLYQKYEGLLAQNPFFDNVLYTKLEDQTKFVTGSGFSTQKGMGKYQYWMNSNSSIFTQPMDLVVGEPPVATNHDTFLFHWDAYSLEKIVEGNTVSLRYSEALPSELGFGIYNTENTYEASTFMETITLDTVDDNISLIFSNQTSNRLYLGGFGIFY